LKIYQELLNDENFKKSVVEYFFDYQIQEQDWERQKNERRQQLSEQKEIRLKAQFPDMDGKARLCAKRTGAENMPCSVVTWR